MSNISRSVYQKLKEENKSLINDIRILVDNEFPPPADKILVIDKWRRTFENEKQFHEFMKTACKTYIKNNPNDPAVKGFHKINEKLKL